METDAPRLKAFAWIAAMAIVMSLVGIMGLDGVVARAAMAAPHWLGALVETLDTITLKGVSNFLLGPLLLAAAAGAAIVKQRAWARRLTYAGLVQGLATFLTDIAKPIFGRMRPFESVADGGPDVWWVGANSFPSGHIGFYAGLALAIVALAPRRGWLALSVPAIVGVERVLSRDHFVSDVFASVAVASILAGVILKIVRPSRL